jgi:hypothetical protein
MWWFLLIADVCFAVVLNLTQKLIPFWVRSLACNTPEINETVMIG